PSFCAAAISSGVTAVGGGAAARSGIVGSANASALEALSTSRRDNVRAIVSSLLRPYAVFGLAGQRPAAFRRHPEPHRRSRRDAAVRLGDDAKLRAVLGLDHIVAARPEKDLPYHLRGNDVVLVGGFRRQQLDLVLTDRHRGLGVGLQRVAGDAKRHAGKR